MTQLLTFELRVTMYLWTHFKDHGLAASPLGLFLPLSNPAADLGLVRS